MSCSPRIASMQTSLEAQDPCPFPVSLVGTVGATAQRYWRSWFQLSGGRGSSTEVGLGRIFCLFVLETLHKAEQKIKFQVSYQCGVVSQVYVLS